ncbi:MAG TPA: HAD family hydrolase [Thermoplasmatales archaeon]|nr:HAD family hydrolase [Thermoplasmatales archaeon]
MKPSAILFDLDGVLIDSLDAWWYSLNGALNLFNIESIERDEFVEKYWGHDLYDNLERAKLPREIGIICSNLYTKHIDKIKLYPDVKETLEKLENYKKAIVTNTPRDCTREILKEFDIARYFDTIVAGGDVSRGKPDPEIIFKACNELNVDPRATLLVGDTESDVKAGKAAGCTVIGVGIEADVTIKKISELLDILD